MNNVIRPLVAADLPAAARINRAAFSKFFGLPEPAKFRIGADVVGPRRRIWPEAGWALEADGELAGVALMMRWGSVCVLGPVTVAPEHWGRGHARALMPKLIEIVDQGNFAFTGLFTHPQSPKHIRLYESYGFMMQRMTAVMAKPVAGAAVSTQQFSRQPAPDRPLLLEDFREFTNDIFPGLDLSGEIADVARHGLGQTLMLETDGKVQGLAVCHFGPGSEATAGDVLVKFAAAADATTFERLLGACETYAIGRGAKQIVAGTNTGRAEAYALMQKAGYRTIMNGIAMTRPSTDGYNSPDVFAIDDWR